jgi:transcription antitermination factor NusG
MPEQAIGFPWYALQVASRCEKAVAAGLALRGYSEFLPLFRSRRRWSDRFQDVDLPLFSGYVFCRLDIDNRLPVLLIPGVVRIVGLGKIPMPVAEGEIAAVQKIASSGLLAQPWPFLKVGQTVTIEEGPLRNVTGILAEIDGSDQLIVSITLLQRSLAVAIPRHSIRPASDSGVWATRRRHATTV